MENGKASISARITIVFVGCFLSGSIGIGESMNGTRLEEQETIINIESW